MNLKNHILRKIKLKHHIQLFKEHLPELDEAIRKVSGKGGDTPIVVDAVQSLEIAFDRYALLNANEWTITHELKMAGRPLEDDEKKYLQIADRLMAVAKTDNPCLIKPGEIVSTDGKGHMTRNHKN